MDVTTDYTRLVQRNEIAPGAVMAYNLAAGLFDVTVVFDGVGPLPTAMGSFTKNYADSTIIFVMHASGYVAVGNNPIPINLEVDGVNVSGLTGYSNEASSHKAVSRTTVHPSTYYGTALLAAGAHSVRFTAGTGTLSDANDYYTIIAIELPTL